MNATIWHNPKCSTSRKALAQLEEKGVEVTVIQYLKTPPTKEELRALYKDAGMTARQGLRTRQDEAKALLNADEETILDAMAQNPVLVERPLVQTDKGTRLARPLERLDDIL